MKKSLFIGIVLFVVLGICSFAFFKSSEKNVYSIETPYGTIKIRLYDETPMHRDNFATLVEEKKYNGTFFDHIVKGYMIQGGEMDPMAAQTGQQRTLPNEIAPNIYAKKGVLVAAATGRQGEAPATSYCQFYIVTGKVYTEPQLLELEGQMAMYEKKMTRQQYFWKIMEEPKNAELKAKFLDLRNRQVEDSAIAIQNEILKQVDAVIVYAPDKKFTAEQTKIYTTVGGVPELDGGYTIFGEVIEGMDIVEKIAAEEADEQGKPLKEIPLTIK